MIGVAGQIITVSAAFTRPTDTNPYAAKDVVANSTSAPIILTFIGTGRQTGGSGYICKVQLFTDQAANTAQFRLHLFHTAPTMINDNAPFTQLYSNRSKRIGYIDIGPLSTEGSGSNCASGMNIVDMLAMVCAGASQDIYGILETLTAFTPVSTQNFYIELSIDQN